jgi:hypothetical protein
MRSSVASPSALSGIASTRQRPRTAARSPLASPSARLSFCSLIKL